MVLLTFKMWHGILRQIIGQNRVSVESVLSTSLILRSSPKLGCNGPGPAYAYVNSAIRTFSSGGSLCGGTPKRYRYSRLLAAGVVVGGGFTLSVSLAVTAFRRNITIDHVSPAMPILKRSVCAKAVSPMMSSASDLQPGWSVELRELYQRFTAELIPKGWRELRSSAGRERNQALFTLSHPDVGAAFEYSVFYSEEEKKTITLVQFGPKTEGPPGYVHGGAIAAVGDMCAGLFLGAGLQLPCMTANLTVNYKKPLPLESTVVIETEIEKAEGRKYFTSSTIKSPDGSVLYSTVSTLFITVKPPQSKV